MEPYETKCSCCFDKLSLVERNNSTEMVIISFKNQSKFLVFGIIFVNCKLLVKLENEKCYDTLGCITISQEWTHPLYRPYNLLPSDRHAINTIFVLWTIQGYGLSPEVIGTNLLNGTNINSHLKILIHDFTSNGYTGWIQHLAKTMLISHPNSGQSIISVDWAAGAEPPYIQAIANARLVALEIVHFISKLKIARNLLMENVHIVGHGIGAHIAGYVGKICPPKRITALDPSGTFFENMPSIVHLSRQDAEYIEVLHTDASPSGQGNKDLLGHADFFANGGSKQPDCKDTRLFLKSVKRGDLQTISNDTHLSLYKTYKVFFKQLGQILKGCSHKRSLKYYIETFINQSCAFLGVPCESYKAFLQGRCTSCGDNMESCVRLNTLNPPRSLSSLFGYYFVTSSAPPFCGEMIKLSICISNNTPDRTYVNGYFNVTIRQTVGDVNFLVNENSIISALRTNKKHTFVVFRSTPPPLLVPIKAIFLKWQHKPLPYTWRTPPRISKFMIYKVTDNITDKPLWFCKKNTSLTHVTFGRELQPCKEDTKNSYT